MKVVSSNVALPQEQRHTRIAAPGSTRAQAGEEPLVSLKVRIIPCLDVDAGRVVKGTKFTNLRDAGDPVELAALYDREGADEIVFYDITASHEQRDTAAALARAAAEEVFVPYTIGGGVRTAGRHARHAARRGRQGLRKQRRRGEPGSHHRRSGTLREPVRRTERGREAARPLPWLGGLPERRAGQHGDGRRRVARRGREAGGRGVRAQQHGRRRDRERLRPRPDLRRRREDHPPHSRLRRGGGPGAHDRGRRTPEPARCSPRASSTSASTA